MQIEMVIETEIYQNRQFYMTKMKLEKNRNRKEQKLNRNIFYIRYRIRDRAEYIKKTHFKVTLVEYHFLHTWHWKLLSDDSFSDSLISSCAGGTPITTLSGSESVSVSVFEPVADSERWCDQEPNDLIKKMFTLYFLITKRMRLCPL